MGLQLPNDFVNGQIADAVPVQNNYDIIEQYINAECITRDGNVTMQAPLNLVGDPTQPNHAANKGYVDAQVPIGTIVAWPVATAPSSTPTGPQWMLCQGQSLQQAEYPVLHQRIGTTFGGGTGTFLLPNLKGRLIFGLDGGTNFTTVGKTGGTFTVPVPPHGHAMPHTHTIAHTHEFPHTHTINHAHAATSSVTVSTNVSTSVRDSPPGTSNSFVRAGTSGTTVINTLNPTVTTDPHTHSIPTSTGLVSGQPNDATTGASSATSSGASSATETADNTVATGPAGGSIATTMIQPYLTLNFIIRVK